MVLISVWARLSFELVGVNNIINVLSARCDCNPTAATSSMLYQTSGSIVDQECCTPASLPVGEHRKLVIVYCNPAGNTRLFSKLGHNGVYSIQRNTLCGSKHDSMVTADHFSRDAYKYFGSLGGCCSESICNNTAAKWINMYHWNMKYGIWKLKNGQWTLLKRHMTSRGITWAALTHKNNTSAFLGFHCYSIRAPCIKVMNMCGDLWQRTSS